MPSLDVSETKSEIVVKAELPGIDPKEIDLSLSDGVLSQRDGGKGEDYHLVEEAMDPSPDWTSPKDVKGDRSAPLTRMGS